MCSREGGEVYTRINFKTKKLLKEAVARGEEVEVFQPGPFASSVPTEGRACVEGPHAPLPHSWYAEVVLEGGRVVRVK